MAKCGVMPITSAPAAHATADHRSTRMSTPATHVATTPATHVAATPAAHVAATVRGDSE